MKLRSVSRILWTLTAAGAGCTSPEPSSTDPGDGGDQGIEEANQALTDLSSECTFVAGTGTLTVAMASGDVAMVGKSTSNQIIINGFACGGATGTTLKKLVVTGTAGAQTLILDFMNGTFAPGVAGTVGIQVDLLGGTDAFKIRGSKLADAFVFGATGMAFNGDAFPDITVAGAESFVVSMSDGDDSFSGAGNAATGGAFASVVTVYGGAGKDTIRGGAGNDILDGGDGDDVFVTGAVADGDDVMTGGAGNDTADYSARTAALTLNIDGLADSGEGVEADTINTDIETVKGGAGNDTIVGSPGNDIIFGGPGDDTITGGLGNDTLNGDGGNDVFLEGTATSGADTFNGGSGVDTVSYALRTVAVVASIDGVANDGEAGEMDKVGTDIENLTGGAGDDTLTGSTADNVLSGGAGNDILNGLAGNDVLRGGAGNDIENGSDGDDTFDEGTAASGNDSLHGGSGVDTVDYSGRTNDLTVVMDGVTASGETGELDVIFTDVENLKGGAGDDAITGNAADNQLEGGAGVDTIFGLAGDDVIDGQAGADIINCGLGDGDILLDTTVASAAGCEL